MIGYPNTWTQMTHTATEISPTGGALSEVKSSQGKSRAYPRILIFSASLVLKGILGALFFGSVDVINSATNSLALLAGRQVHLPYLPTINAFLWFSGVLSATLSVPFVLSLKLVPIVFDSLLGVLVYDLVRQNEPTLGAASGAALCFKSGSPS